MGSQSDPRLQTACQELLKKEGAFSGFLRQKTILHKLCEGFAEQITSRIAWRRHYYVVYDGFLYDYKNETETRAAKVIDLRLFQRVERNEYMKVKGVPWPLKVISDIPNVGILHFGATSESELKKWIKALKKGIDDAKETGREPVALEQKPVAMEQKVNSPKETKMPKKKQPKQSSKEDKGDDSDTYTAVSEPDDDDDYQYQSGSDYTSVDGHSVTSENAETETFSIPREEVTLPPQLPAKKIGPTKSNPIDSKPSVLQTEITQKAPALPKKKLGHVADVRKKPPPKEEPKPDVDLVSEATWTGSSEEGIEKMRSIVEDGVFMLRESTTGKEGELTLQVISDEAVRKYRITKEGTRFRMTGGSTFDSVSELLVFYLNNSIPNHQTKLTKPFSRI